MIGSAHHYGVTVSDLDRSLAFYRDRLGMEVVDRLSLDGDAFGRFVGTNCSSTARHRAKTSPTAPRTTMSARPSSASRSRSPESPANDVPSDRECSPVRRPRHRSTYRPYFWYPNRGPRCGVSPPGRPSSREMSG
jgi:catechol 2,3-dioxygenase-like lactoylglutathione lyase family enzyme